MLKDESWLIQVDFFSIGKCQSNSCSWCLEFRIWSWSWCESNEYIWNTISSSWFQRLGQQQRDALLRGHSSLVRTGEALHISRQTAHETEQLGNEIMADLTTQRETLLRTQDRVRKLCYYQHCCCISWIFVVKWRKWAFKSW